MQAKSTKITPTRWVHHVLLLLVAGSLWLGVSSLLFPASATTSPAQILGESGHAYKFLSQNEFGPAVWPCNEPITIALNVASLDAASQIALRSDLKASLDAIEAASGFSFRFVGLTSAVPTKSWGHDWVNVSPRAQVVVAVVPAPASDLLVDEGAAIGGSFFKENDLGQLRSFTGYVVIKSERFFDYVQGSGPMSHQALLTHELLHVLNLDHVADPDSLLTVRLSDSNGFLGPGDTEGLAKLHAASCGS